MHTKTQSAPLSTLKNQFTSNGTALNTEQVLGVEEATQGRRFYGFLACAALAFAGGYWYLDDRIDKASQSGGLNVSREIESAASLALQRKASPTAKYLDLAPMGHAGAEKNDRLFEAKQGSELSSAPALKDQLTAGQFAVDSVALTPSTRAMLDEWARRLKADRSMRVRIAGHADDRGTTKYNDSLSYGRAEAAKKYLVSKGVAAARMVSLGHGKRRPLVKGDGETVWAKNRRIELKPRYRDKSHNKKR